MTYGCSFGNLVDDPCAAGFAECRVFTCCYFVRLKHQYPYLCTFLTRPSGRGCMTSTHSTREDVADRGSTDRSPAPWDGLATRHATFGSRTSLPQQWSAAVADWNTIKIKSPDVQDEFFVQSGVILGATRRTGRETSILLPLSG